MDPITEGELQSTPTPTTASSPAISSLAVAKTPESPRPRPRPGMPAGPRIRKTTNTAISIHTLGNDSSSTVNVRRISSESTVVTSGRTSPAPSSQGAQSPISERRYTVPPPPITEDKEVQTDEIRPETPIPPPRLSPTPEPPRVSTPGYKVVSKPVTLPFPTPINFTPSQIPFRGLTLEAAQWTFTSDQLRDIVSRAIRDSAKESFIHLLPPEALEKEIPEETERLESLRFTTQAQHRFHFQRRTNLLQGLNALASTIPVMDDGGANPIAAITAQLAEISSAMDRFTETLLHASDQRAQMAHVQDVHVSSALAMALRKLNASYSKRTADLKQSRARIQALEAELEEAWKVAEDMAQEVDELDNFGDEYGLGDEIEGSEDALPESENGGGLMVDEEDFTVKSVTHARVVGITKAIASKATLVSSPTTGSSAEGAVSPVKRERARSTTSRASSAERDRTSWVSAARKRSTRASKASLRMPKLVTDIAGIATHKRTRSRSKSNSKKSPEDAPSVPPIPGGLDSANGRVGNSFLELSRPASPQPSDEEIPPVPTLLQASQPVLDEASSATSGATSGKAVEDVQEGQTEVTVKVNGEDEASPPYSAGFDRSFIPALAVDTASPQLLRATSFIAPLESPNSHSVKPRRIQSMQPITTSILSTSSSIAERQLSNLEEDEEDNSSSPAKTTITQDDQQIAPAKHHDLDKFDPWPWSMKKKPAPPSRPVPLPPPSPTPSSLTAIPPLHTDKPKNAATSLFRFTNRRNSMPSPSGAIAALLPWRPASKRPSSEPDLPSQGGPMSPLSTSSS